MTPALEEAQRLLRLACRDRDTFVLLRSLVQASPAAVGFHAQQAVEKALKSVSVLRGIEVRRTHDLAALAGAVLAAGESLPRSVDELRLLNPFAVEFRYDDEMTPLIGPEPLECIVTDVISWATQRVGHGLS